MIDSNLQKIEAQRAAVAAQIRRYMDPFVKKDKGDIKALKRDESMIEAQISRTASEFLKAAGFRADGSKRKVKK